MNNPWGGLLGLLETLIGFTAVMALLSLVVTALAQFVKSALRLRGRNLYRGLTVLFDSIGSQSDAHAPKDLAEKVCLSRDLMSIERRMFEKKIQGISNKIPADSSKLRIPIWLTGSARTHISKDELKELIQKYEGGVKTEHLNMLLSQVDKFFPRLETGLDQRFQFIMRVVSVGCAVGVAFVFQVSALKLLQDLSTDPELRAKYVLAAEGVLAESEASLKRLTSYEDVSEEALRRLQAKHPELALKLEEVSGAGSSKGDMLDELGFVLQDVPTRPAILREYDSTLIELYKEQNKAALDQLHESTGKLATFDIRPWAYGGTFYVSSAGLEWKNLLGVMVTAILLTFGAPFWFEQLKDVAKLRDVFSQRQAETNKGQGKNPEPAGPKQDKPGSKPSSITKMEQPED